MTRYTTVRVRALCLIASQGQPHEDGAVDLQLAAIPKMSDAERSYAGRMYESLIGEALLPARVGRVTVKPARAFRHNTEQNILNARARAKLEARRDLA